MTKFLTMRLTNALNHCVSLVVEPWGEIYPMPAGTTFEVRFEITGEEPVHLPEVVWTEEQVLVYAGVGGDIELRHGGLDLRAQILNGQKTAVAKLAA